jgi:alpha-methylacyl-CoA racemase
MAVGALEPQFYLQLIELLGLSDADLPHQMDQDRWPDIRAVFAEVFASKTQAEWVRVFAGTDACVAPVVPLDEAAAHPHLAARRTFTEHGGVTQPSPAPRFGGVVEGVKSPPSIGQHTDEVLAMAGFDSGEIEDLRARRIVG